MASDEFWVKPVRGLVLHPRTKRPLPPEGANVTSERGYFTRMLTAGDVIQIAPPLPRSIPRQPKKEM